MNQYLTIQKTNALIMKRVISLIALYIIGYQAASSQLTIEYCQEKARVNYPLIQQVGLIKETESYNLANANKGYLPQLAISAKATYQSDVTSLPISMPGVNKMDKDQYQAVAEISQVVWDGGMIGSQKKITRASTTMDIQRTEVDLYALRERVNQLYFGILLLNEQLEQNDWLQKELQVSYEKVSAYMNGGIANQSDVDAIRVEQLKTKQRRAELQALLKSYEEMLSAMMNEPITEGTMLQKPETMQLTQETSLANNRPELRLFDAQRDFYSSQESSIKSGNLPKINLFFQGGVGKPGLNMLDTEMSTFYVTGVRLAWNFGGLYTQKNNLNKLKINQQLVDVQQQTFEYNNNLKVLQQKNEIAKINEQLSGDNEIVMLRGNIKKAAEVKVENGTLAVSDLIREINAENLAKQDKSLHEIQLLMSIHNLKYTLNNYE